MNLIIPLLKNYLNEQIAIMITSGNYDKNFYEGILIEVNEKYITLEIAKETYMNFEFKHFILATPLHMYQ